MNILHAVLVLTSLGAVFALMLAIASKVFEVETDPRLPEIMDALPGANCGGCGFAGCTAAANAIIDGSAPVGVCPVGGSDSASKIATIMGVEASSSEKMVAFVKCNGGTNAKTKFQYVGVQDCTAALKVGAGPLECNFGCLGFGSCVTACAFDAIEIGANGTAVVNRNKCTSCMACATACPRKLIIAVPASSEEVVPCSSKDKGIVSKAVCGVSCIGCKLCEKNCEAGAITVVDNCAVIDYSKCTNCGTCVTKCPRKLIIDVTGKVVAVAAKPAAPKAPVAPKAPEAPKAEEAPKTEEAPKAE